MTSTALDTPLARKATIGYTINMVMPVLTTTQFLIRLDRALTGVTLDLSRTDIRKVDMLLPEVRKKLTIITTRAAQSDGEFIDLSYADISGRDFSYYDLTHTIMSGVKAQHTIFAGSNLSDIQLEDADASYADFRNARMHYTKMYNTIIVGANFTGTDLTHVLGLKLTAPGSETVKRLGVTASITGAMLPPSCETIRDKIQQMIDKRRPAKKQDISSVQEKTGMGGLLVRRLLKRGGDNGSTANW